MTVAQAPAAAAVLALEELAARSWPATETASIGGWLARAASGWTSRANSCLALDGLPADLDRRLEEVRRWYAERGLPALLAVPLPACADLAGVLAARGWAAGTLVLVQTASLAEVARLAAALPGLPAPVWAPAPPEAWLARYRAAEGPLPPVAAAVLGGGGASFASLVVAGSALAVARCTVDGRWAGLAAFEVVTGRRRRGVATHLLHHVAARALDRGAAEAWLQVAEQNTAGVALYGRAGFTTHHTYRYYRAPDEEDRP